MKLAFISLFALSLGQPEQVPLHTNTALPSNGYQDALTSAPETSHSFYSGETVDASDVVDSVINELFLLINGVDVGNSTQRDAFRTILGLKEGQPSLLESIKGAAITLKITKSYLETSKSTIEKTLEDIITTLYNLAYDEEYRRSGKYCENVIKDQIRGVSEAYVPIVENTLPFIRNTEIHRHSGICLMHLNALSRKWDVDTQHLQNVVRKLEEAAPPFVSLGNILEPNIQNWIDELLPDIYVRDSLCRIIRLNVGRQQRVLAESMVGYLLSPAMQSITHVAEQYQQSLANDGARPASEVITLLSEVIALAKDYNFDIQQLEEVVSQIS